MTVHDQTEATTTRQRMKFETPATFHKHSRTQEASRLGVFDNNKKDHFSVPGLPTVASPPKPALNCHLPGIWFAEQTPITLLTTCLSQCRRTNYHFAHESLKLETQMPD